MSKFRLYAGMQSEEYNLHMFEVEGIALLEAMDEAEQYAYEIYCWNPDRDMMEIMEQDKVDEDVAFSIFRHECENRVIYFLEELVEINREVVEVIKHDWM